LPAIGACDDGLDCTTDDTCIGGTCTGIDACPSGTHCDAETATCRPTAASTTTIPLASTTTLPTFGSTTTSTTPGTATCGDGVVDPDEQCDDGDTQWQSGEACTAECVLVFCGDTDASGSLSVTDALFILQAALGTNECDPSVCDVDHTLTHVSASDALRLLRFALGLPVELDCPDAQ
jgi:cysteine-rich repeat protein